MPSTATYADAEDRGERAPPRRHGTAPRRRPGRQHRRSSPRDRTNPHPGACRPAAWPPARTWPGRSGGPSRQARARRRSLGKATAAATTDPATIDLGITERGHPGEGGVAGGTHHVEDPLVHRDGRGMVGEQDPAEHRHQHQPQPDPGLEPHHAAPTPRSTTGQGRSAARRRPHRAGPATRSIGSTHRGYRGHRFPTQHPGGRACPGIVAQRPGRR